MWIGFLWLLVFCVVLCGWCVWLVVVYVWFVELVGELFGVFCWLLVV